MLEVMLGVGAMLQFLKGLFCQEDYYVVLGDLFEFLLSRLN